MFQIVFLWGLLAGGVFAGLKKFKKDKKERYLYICFASTAAILTLFLEYENGLGQYISLLLTTFGEVTKMVINQ